MTAKITSIGARKYQQTASGILMPEPDQMTRLAPEPKHSLASNLWHGLLRVLNFLWAVAFAVVIGAPVYLVGFALALHGAYSASGDRSTFLAVIEASMESVPLWTAQVAPFCAGAAVSALAAVAMTRRWHREPPKTPKLLKEP